MPSTRDGPSAVASRGSQEDTAGASVCDEQRKSHGEAQRKCRGNSYDRMSGTSKCRSDQIRSVGGVQSLEGFTMARLRHWGFSDDGQRKTYQQVAFPSSHRIALDRSETSVGTRLATRCQRRYGEFAACGGSAFSMTYRYRKSCQTKADRSTRGERFKSSHTHRREHSQGHQSRSSCMLAPAST